MSKGVVAKGGSVLDNAFINGWTKDKILALPKGSRPNPTDYLSADYIKNHLAKFDNGVVRFTSRDGMKTYGTLGPDGGFVIPKQEFDEIIRVTGGDLRKIEQKLGLDVGYLDDSDVLIAFIENKNLKGLKMPSGNVPEAVVDFSHKPAYLEIKIK